MPIQIFELIVKVTVDDKQVPYSSGSVNIQDREDLISECVEQTLERLEQMKER